MSDAAERRDKFERTLDLLDAGLVPSRHESRLMRLLDREDESEVADAVRESLLSLWANPEQFATTGSGDLLDDRLTERDEFLLRMGVVFGIEYETAYPTGERDRWPVPVEARPSADEADDEGEA